MTQTNLEPGTQGGARDVGAAAMEKAAGELCAALALGKCQTIALGYELPHTVCGAYVPLVGDNSALQVAVIGDGDALGQLARKLLQMEAAEPLDDRDTADAVCEIGNMLAGKVKFLLARQYPTLRIGLPVFIHGEIHGQGQSGVVLDVWLGSIPTTLLLISRGV
jgi:hypothetical protein